MSKSVLRGWQLAFCRPVVVTRRQLRGSGWQKADALLSHIRLTGGRLRLANAALDYVGHVALLDDRDDRKKCIDRVRRLIDQLADQGFVSIVASPGGGLTAVATEKRTIVCLHIARAARRRP
jgi:hypothetical protein